MASKFIDTTLYYNKRDKLDFNIYMKCGNVFYKTAAQHDGVYSSGRMIVGFTTRLENILAQTAQLGKAPLPQGVINKLAFGRVKARVAL